MKKRVILIVVIIALLILTALLIKYSFNKKNSASNQEITNISCSLEKPCPQGLECFKFPEKNNPACAKSNPCSYYKCDIEKSCTVLETYPGQVKCV